MNHLWAVVAAAMIAASGCLGNAASQDAELPSDVVPSVDAPVAATAKPGDRPVWTHGDWYEFKVVFDAGFGPLLNAQSKLVVGRADKDGYQLAPGNRDLGVIDAHFDDFFVGDLDLDLNAKLGTQNVNWRMFQWPLEDGKVWNSDLNPGPFAPGSVPIQFTAAATDKGGDPKSSGPGFAVSGKADDGTRIRFLYSSGARWITEYEKKDASGRTLLSMQMVDRGSNYTGVFHIVTKKDLYQRVVAVPFFVFDPSLSPVPPVDQFRVSDDFTFLQEVIALFSMGTTVPPAPRVPGSVVASVAIVFPDNQQRQESMTATGESFKIILKDYETYLKGTYTIDFTVVGTGGGAFVGYFGFTDQVIVFGKQSHVGHTSGG